MTCHSPLVELYDRKVHFQGRWHLNILENPQVHSRYYTNNVFRGVSRADSVHPLSAVPPVSIADAGDGNDPDLTPPELPSCLKLRARGANYCHVFLAAHLLPAKNFQDEH